MKNSKTSIQNSSSITDSRKKPALVVTNEIVYFTKDQYELRLGEIYAFLKGFPIASIIGHIATFAISYGATQIFNWVNEHKNEFFSFVNFLCENKINISFVSFGFLLWGICIILWKKKRGLKSLKKRFLKINADQQFKSQVVYDLCGELLPQE